MRPGQVGNCGYVLTALIGFLGVIVGVLVGGGMQLLVAARERKLESRRSARLLFADQRHAEDAVEYLLDHDAWWSNEMAPPLSGWLQHRHSFAGAMDGLAFLDVDAAFFRVASLERSRSLRMPPAEMRDAARGALEMLDLAGSALLLEGFSRSEQRRTAEMMMRDETGQEPAPPDAAE